MFISEKIAIVGLGVNFINNYDEIIFLFKNKEILFIDKNKEANAYILSITHEEFFIRPDKKDYKIIFTSYGNEGLYTQYKMHGLETFLFIYNKKYDSIVNIIELNYDKINQEPDPVFKVQRNIFITGSTSGIGLELARTLLKKNYIVYGLSKSESQIINDNYHHIKFDLGVNKVFDSVIDILPQNLNTVYLNAGISLYKEKFLEYNINEIEKIFMVNAFSNIILLNALTSAKKINFETSIVFSKTNIKNSINEAIYSSSKIAFEKYIDEYTVSSGIEFKNIFKIDPGWLKTNMGGVNAPNSVSSIMPSFLLPLISNIRSKEVSINALDFSKGDLVSAFKKLNYFSLI